jgi:hypothetical protein
MTTTTSILTINVYDGTRELLSPAVDVLYRVIDGNQKQIYADFQKTSSLKLDSLPFYDNFGDNYTAIVSAKGYRQAGFTPIPLSPNLVSTIDLMLLPNNAQFNFADAPWNEIAKLLPFLASGVNDVDGRTRYENLMENKAATLAALLNITTAMSEIHLPEGTPLDYLKQIKWDDSMAQDRFFAYCDPKLLSQVRTAAAQGTFAPELGSGFFHPGATASWKQIQFGEANVQLTFHESDQASVDGMSCIAVEPDIDYFKDLGAHALLEVLGNAITGGLTNPEVVYVLRWIAGLHSGVAEFHPPYKIV